MASADQTARSLQRASSALDGVITALVSMRAGAAEKCPPRLTEVATALEAVVRGGVPAAEKAAAAPIAAGLKTRIETIKRLLAAAQRLCGLPADAEPFHGYTPEGERELIQW